MNISKASRQCKSKANMKTQIGSRKKMFQRAKLFWFYFANGAGYYVLSFYKPNFGVISLHFYHFRPPLVKVLEKEDCCR